MQENCIWRNIRMIEASQFEFLDYPCRRSKEEYYLTLSRYVESVKNDDILSIYQIGSVSNPGISDLDIILILKNLIRYKDVDAYSIANLDDLDRYIFMHNIYVLPESVSDAISVVFNIENINLVYGDDLKNRINGKFDIRTDTNAKVACIIDFGLDILKGLILSILDRKVLVRPMLCLLFSLRHTILLYNALCLSPLACEKDFISKIVELRNACFTISRLTLQKELLSLIEAGIMILAEILANINLLLKSPGYFGEIDLREDCNNKTLTYEYKFYYVFTNQFDWHQILENIFRFSYNSSRIYKKIFNRVAVPLPEMIYYHYLCYANCHGPISRKVMKNLSQSNMMGNYESKGLYTYFLKEKNSLGNEEAVFLLRNGFDYGQMVLNSFFPIPSADSTPMRTYKFLVERFNRWHLRRVNFI